MLAAPHHLVAWCRRALGAFWRELVKFGLVGAVAFVVDVGGFNLLRWGGEGLLADKPVTAKIISASVATLVAWAGNRWWTFRRRRQPALARELLLFALMNGVAMLISVVCLATSHYALGLDSALADNVSANIIGVGLGTAFRFYAYRTWVFCRADDAVVVQLPVPAHRPPEAAERYAGRAV